MVIKELLPKDFPTALREIPKPPNKLWLRGEMPPEGTKLLAVVGSRALSRYGREACEMLIGGLRGYPISVVSGLALGADACAHKAAIDAGLHTIAIPGSGLDESVIGPRTNLHLSKLILAKGGALLSENEPKHIAAPYDFPSRNRIMVGLADAVLIIEAGRQSGTLITAGFAGDFNRELLCVPHRIGDAHGFGAEVFLRLGATLVTEPEHILEALRIPVREGPLGNDLDLASLSKPEKLVYDMLVDSICRDDIIRYANLAPSETLGALIHLNSKVSQKKNSVRGSVCDAI